MDPDSPRRTRGPSLAAAAALLAVLFVTVAVGMLLAAQNDLTLQVGPCRLSARLGDSDWDPGFSHFSYAGGEAWNLRLGDAHWTVQRVGP